MVEHRKTIMYQEISGKKGLRFDANFCSRLDSVRAQGNPFIIKALEVILQNFVTEQVDRQ